MIHLVAEVIWIDFFNINPNRTRDHAVSLMLWSPLTALILTLLWGSVPLAAGAVVHALGCMFGRVAPLWLAISICLVCVAVRIFLDRGELSDEETFISRPIQAWPMILHFGLAAFVGVYGARLLQRLWLTPERSWRGSIVREAKD